MYICVCVYIYIYIYIYIYKYTKTYIYIYRYENIFNAMYVTHTCAYTHTQHLRGGQRAAAILQHLLFKGRNQLGNT